ncbi:unnamed protein product [Closterium sp. NIES-54]
MSTAAVGAARAVVEYARSGRAACRHCSKAVAKDDVRVGVVTKGNGGFDVTKWYHAPCVAAANSLSIESPSSLQGFTRLKPSDQQSLQAILTRASAAAPGASSPDSQPAAAAIATAVAAAAERGREGKGKRVMEGAVGEEGGRAGAVPNGVVEAGGAFNADESSSGDSSGPEMKRSKVLSAGSATYPAPSPAVKKVLGTFSHQSLKGLYKGESSGTAQRRGPHPPVVTHESVEEGLEDISRYMVPELFKPRLRRAIAKLVAADLGFPVEAVDSPADVPLPPGWFAFSSVILHQSPNLKPSSRIAAFDFDGCLVNTNVRIMGPNAWSLMFDTVPSVLQHFHQAGYKIVIFTNESNIDRFTKQRHKAIESKIGRLNGFMRAVPGVPMQIFISCGRSNSGDLFRKPEVGLWHLLCECGNEERQVEWESSFFVGDAAGRPQDHSDSDQVFAQRLNLPFYLPEDATPAQPAAARSPSPRAARSRTQPVAARSPQPHAASSHACPARVPACAARCCLARCLRKRTACCCLARRLRCLSAASYCPASCLCCLLLAASVLACSLLPAASCLLPAVSVFACGLLPTASCLLPAPYCLCLLPL